MTYDKGRLADYVDVAARIAEFRDKHPDGSLQPADPAQPYRIERLAERSYVVYVAAAYRTPDDPRPGIGVAWEPWPGGTPYTRDSELQNAETSAWGRAIVAALAADTRRGIASAEEIHARAADRDQRVDRDAVMQTLRQVASDRGWTPDQVRNRLWAAFGKQAFRDLSDVELREAVHVLRSGGPPVAGDGGPGEIQRQEALADAAGT